MKRDSADITRRSAANIAKWRIKEMLKDKNNNLNMMQKAALNIALSDGGAIEQIADILYDAGMMLSVDRNNPEHQAWIEAGAVELS